MYFFVVLLVCGRVLTWVRFLSMMHLFVQTDGITFCVVAANVVLLVRCAFQVNTFSSCLCVLCACLGRAMYWWRKLALEVNTCGSAYVVCFVCYQISVFVVALSSGVKVALFMLSELVL